MNYFYIYNILQADFFVKRGLMPIEIGRGNKGHIYVKFVRDDNSNAIFERWTNYEH